VYLFTDTANENDSSGVCLRLRPSPSLMLVIVCGSQGYALKPGLPLRCSEERTKTSLFVKRYGTYIYVVRGAG